jgi:hypothetical protein
MSLRLAVSNACTCETCQNDSVRIQQAFQARHPGVVFSVTPGKNFKACYTDLSGQPQEFVYFTLTALMHRLKTVEHTIREDSPAQ